MKISELVALEEDMQPSCAWGVELDTPVLALPKKLHFIAVTAEFSDESKTDFSAQFKAKVVNLSLARSAQVIIEIPPNHDLNLKQIFQFCCGTGTGLSLLFDTLLHNKYVSDCKEIAKLMLTTPNFSQIIQPIHSYLEYLAADTLITKKNVSGNRDQFEEQPPHGVPTEDYILEVFVKKMPQTLVDDFKLGVYEAVEEVFGSHEDFKKSIVTSAIAHAEEFKVMFEEELEEQEAEMQQTEEPTKDIEYALHLTKQGIKDIADKLSPKK